MSRSKRLAQGTTSPAPRREKRISTSPGGGLRTGWLLAVSLAAWGAVALAARFGLIRAFAALFEAWGIDADTASLAPGWARALYVWHGSAITVIFALLTLALAYRLRKLWLGGTEPPRFDGRGFGLSVLAGTGCALAVAAICLLPDSVRPAWPVSAPRLTGALTVLCAVSLLSALAEEAFTKRVLYDGLRGRWGVIWTTAAVCAVFFLSNRGYRAGWIGGLNALLLGLAGCLIYARHGLWAAAGFRWAWSAVNTFLLGFGGGGASVYSLYGVSESLLTGGDAGPAYGLWTTLTLAALNVWLLLPGIRRCDGRRVPDGPAAQKNLPFS